jgi:hypothetical protein
LANACARVGDAEAGDAALERFEVLYRQALQGGVERK